MANLPTQIEALQYVDTVVRQTYGGQLGKAELLSGDIMVEGHKAWRYEIEGLPMSRDARQRWVLDTGELFDTTLNETENTPEKALAKRRQLINQSGQSDTTMKERATLQSVNLLLPQEVFARNMQTSQLSSYIQRLIREINQVLPSESITCQLRLRIELAPSEVPTIAIDYQGNVSDGTLSSIHQSLLGLEAPKATSDTLSFEVLVSVAE